MLNLLTIPGNFLRKFSLCFALTALAILTFASKGGGGDKNKSKLSFNKEFVPIRTTGGFTLKRGPVYGGSQLLNLQKQKDVVLYSSIITYQKGNATFILPYKYKINVPGKKSNLNVLDLKINLRK